MTKKRLLLIASLPLAIVVILGVLAMLPPGPGVTKANFARIQDRMTRAEVEGILGQGGEHVAGHRDRETGSFEITYWDADGKSGALIIFQGESVFTDSCARKETFSPQ